MGHAEHFLSRLTRLDADQEELALALYRDPPLVRAVIEAAKVPDGAGRVALALTSDTSPPHVLVTRDGAFVTCLGEGMSVHEAAVVPHLRFLELRHNVVSLREAYDRARAVTSDPRREKRLVLRLLEAGFSLTREEMETAVAVAPLWHRDLFPMLGELSDELSALRRELLHWRNPERWSRSAHGEEKLRRLWLVTWAVSHLTPLLPASDPGHAMSPEKLAKYFVFMFYDAMEGFLPAAVRFTWAAMRAGTPAADLFQRHADGDEVMQRMNAVVGLTALGSTGPSLRAHVLDWMKQPRNAPPGVPDLAPLRLELAEVLEEPDEVDAALVSTGQGMLWGTGRRRKQLRWATAQHVPESLARAVTTHVELDPYDGRGLRLLLNSLPWLARAALPELYMPAADLPCGPDDEPFERQLGLDLLENLRGYNARAPKRVEAAPGRNEPCPCGSSKKFKKCCAASG